MESAAEPGVPGDEAVAEELTRRALRLEQMVALLALGVPAMVVAVLGARRATLAWAAFTLSANLLRLVLLHRALRAPRAQLRRAVALVIADLAIGGVTWGVLAVLIRDDAVSSGQRAFVMTALVLALSANLVFGAPRTALFVAYQVPLAVVGSVSLLSAPDHEVRWLGVLLAVAAAGTMVLQRFVKAVLTDAVTLAHRNAGLVTALRREQERATAIRERLVHQATHDHLTGLGNRILLDEQLDRLLGRARRAGDLLALVMFDIDRFKSINDSLGHAAGDQLLKAVAERVRDSLGHRDLLVRLGGDEFVAVVHRERGGSADDALAVGRAVVAAFQRPFPVEGRSLRVTTSVGVAVARPDDTADDLLRFGDLALYRAKACGRNRVEEFDEAMRASLAAQLDDEADLRRGLAAGEIRTWFQPIVEIATGRLAGFEALARWEHPSLGVLTPDAFLPMVDRCDLHRELGAAVGRQAAEFRRSLSAQVPSGFRVHVNVAAKALALDELVEQYLAARDRSGFDLRGFGIELTEGVVGRDQALAAAALHRAREAGLAVTLDDFGTGSSSLSLVRDLPFDGVKVDGSFTAALLDHPPTVAVVSAVVGLANRLGMDVTAEGVENAEQHTLLGALGCRYAQGFLYSPAVPADQATAWLGEAPWSELLVP